MNPVSAIISQLQLQPQATAAYPQRLTIRGFYHKAVILKPLAAI